MDKIFEELLVEESGINKESIDLADDVVEQIIDKVNSDKLHFVPVTLSSETFPTAFLTASMSKDSHLYDAVRSISIGISDITGYNFNDKKEKESFIDINFNGTFNYSRNLKVITGYIAIERQGKKYIVVSDVSNMAHEMVHAYQGMMGSAYPEMSVRASNLSVGEKNPIMHAIYFGLYWFSPMEITARVNQLYDHIRQKNYKTKDEIFADREFNSYINSCKMCMDALDSLFDEDEMKNQSKESIKNVKERTYTVRPEMTYIKKEIEEKMKMPFDKVVRALRRGNNTFLTKLYKVINYYLNERKTFENWNFPSDSYMRNRHEIRKLAFDNF